MAEKANEMVPYGNELYSRIDYSWKRGRVEPPNIGFLRHTWLSSDSDTKRHDVAKKMGRIPGSAQS